MDERQRQRWLREFEQLGTEKVRSGMITGGWEKEKRTTARQWLERRDARDFQAARRPGSSPSTFIMKRRGAKWWAYVAGGAFLILGITRLFRMF